MNIDERPVKHGTVWSCQGQLTETAGDELSPAATAPHNGAAAES